MCGVLKSSAYFVSAHALHFLLAPCALLITHTPRGTACIPCWDKRFYSILHALYSIYNSYATRAFVCAQTGNRSASTLSSSSLPSHFPYFLPLAARTASQPAASDVIWLLSTTRGSVVFPLPPYHVSFPTFFPPSPTCASFQRSSAYLIISANSFRDTYRSRSRAKFQNTQAVTLKIIAGLRQRRRRPQQ